MTNTVEHPRNYAYPLVMWSSTLIAGVVALITSAMLNLLSAALGVAAAASGARRPNWADRPY